MSKKKRLVVHQRGLTLTRRENEGIDLLFGGEAVRIVPLRIGSGRVVLHIVAPKTIRVLRSELTDDALTAKEVA